MKALRICLTKPPAISTNTMLYAVAPRLKLSTEVKAWVCGSVSAAFALVWIRCLKFLLKSFHIIDLNVLNSNYDSRFNYSLLRIAFR